MYNIMPKYMDMIVIKIVVPVQHDIDCTILTPVNRTAVFKSNGSLWDLLNLFYHNEVSPCTNYSPNIIIMKTPNSQ